MKDARIVRLAEIVEEVKQSEEWEEVRMSIYSVGVERGMVLGKAEGKDEAILVFLGKFGSFSEELRNKILGQKEAAVVDDWLKKACAANSIEDFVKSIEADA